MREDSGGSDDDEEDELVGFRGYPINSQVPIVGGTFFILYISSNRDVG